MAFLVTGVLMLILTINSSQDAVAIQEQVQLVQIKLDEFSEWLFSSSGDIFPPVSVLDRGADFDAPSPNNSLTFMLHEAELATTSGREARKANVVICPLAGLINEDQPDQNSLELKFQCFCENSDHTRQLEYKCMCSQSRLVKTFGMRMWLAIYLLK